MASVSPKVPIPLPMRGLMYDRNPRQVGAEGLLESKNWILRDGFFRVRDGMLPLAAARGDNLFLEDRMSTPYTATMFITTPSTRTFQNMVAGTYWPSTLGGEPYDPIGAFKSHLFDDYSMMSKSAVITTTWTAGDPTFLDLSGLPVPKTTYVKMGIGTAGNLIYYSTIIPASRKRYEAQAKFATHIYGGTTASGTFGLQLVGLLILENSDWVPGDPAEDKYSTTIVGTGPYVTESNGWADPAAPIRCTFDNLYGEANYLILRLTWYGASSGDRLAVGEMQINAGESGAAFNYPSTVSAAGTETIGHRPVGFSDFVESDNNIITIVSGTATDDSSGGWWSLKGNYSWELIGGTALTTVNKSDQTVFRVFDGEDPSGTGSDRYLLGVCGLTDNAKYWDGSNDAADIEERDTTPAENIKAKCMATSFNRVLYGNVIVGAVTAPDGVVHTGPLTFDRWGAGYGQLIRLADTPGAIVSMMEMGNMMTAIYKEDAIYMAIGQSAMDPFRFELKQANIVGPCSPLSVVPVTDGQHVFLAANGDVVIFDGVRTSSLGAHIQAYVKDTINWDRRGESFGFYDKRLKELYFFYPQYGTQEGFSTIMIAMSGDFPSLWPIKWGAPVTCGGYTNINKTKTIHELPGHINDLQGTIDGFADLVPALILMDATGTGQTLSGFYDWEGPINAYFRTGLYDLGEITLMKTVKEIDHLFKSGPGQSVVVSLVINNHGRSERKTPDRTVDLDEGGPYVTGHRECGRLFSMTMASDSTEYIEWLGSEASVEPRGYR